MFTPDDNARKVAHDMFCIILFMECSTSQQWLRLNAMVLYTVHVLGVSVIYFLSYCVL